MTGENAANPPIFTAFFKIFLCALALVALVSMGCKSEKINTEIQLSSLHKVLLLDTVSAAQLLTKDGSDGLFDQLGVLDMALQMRKNYPLSSDRAAVLSDYKAMLQSEVLPFTAEDAELLAKTMSDAFALCNKIGERVFPEEIKVVKVKGNYYGPEAFYTRNNAIIIPENKLKKPKYEAFLRVMLHEIGHIVMRNHPSVKKTLYALAHFSPLDNPVVIPDSLRQVLLVNPDGLDRNWFTTVVRKDKKAVMALPLIMAADTAVVPNARFDQNMGWDFFELVPSGDSTRFTVGPSLDALSIAQQFKKNCNTDYVIHPDEIVADNFALLTFGQKSPKALDGLSENGRNLLEKMREVLAGM